MCAICFFLTIAKNQNDTYFFFKCTTMNNKKLTYRYFFFINNIFSEMFQNILWARMHGRTWKVCKGGAVLPKTFQNQFYVYSCQISFNDFKIIFIATDKSGLFQCHLSWQRHIFYKISRTTKDIKPNRITVE